MYVVVLAQSIAKATKPSNITDFHLAVGQTLNYRLALRKEQPERILYLAISSDTYQDFFNRQFIQDAIAEYQIKLLIFDPIKLELTAPGCE